MPLLTIGAAALAALRLAVFHGIPPGANHPSGAVAPSKGLVVTGRVLEVDGRPIAGARVARGSDPTVSREFETTTDSQGHFQFRGVEPGELILTAQARGHAPEMKILGLKERPQQVELRLGPGHTLRGRVVDPPGEPIVGEPISAGYWRGHRTLRWQTVTDAEGRYRWDDAPADAVLIDLGTMGFTSKRFQQVSASGKEVVTPMRRPLRIRGTVTDAETGKPIRRFNLLPGEIWGNAQHPRWNFDRIKALSGHPYEFDLGSEVPVQILRAEAEGHLPEVSREFKENERDPVFNFKLRHVRAERDHDFAQRGGPPLGPDRGDAPDRQPPRCRRANPSSILERR